MCERLKIELNAKLSELRTLPGPVEQFGEAYNLGLKMNFVINLALEELITNTVIHGQFDNLGQPRIYIDLRVENQTVFLVVESDGRPFDPTQDTHPDTTSELDSRPIGGLGLHLVKSQADRISYAYINDRNRLQLEYDIVPE